MFTLALAALLAARGRGLLIEEIAALIGADARALRRAEIVALVGARRVILPNAAGADAADVAAASRIVVARMGRAFAGASLAV
jgi:hypothetical protein